MFEFGTSSFRGTTAFSCNGFLYFLLFFLFCGSQLSRKACIFILLSVNVRANSKDLTTEEMRKLIERSVK